MAHCTFDAPLAIRDREAHADAEARAHPMEPMGDAHDPAAKIERMHHGPQRGQNPQHVRSPGEQHAPGQRDAAPVSVRHENARIEPAGGGIVIELHAAHVSLARGGRLGTGQLGHAQPGERVVGLQQRRWDVERRHVEAKA